jgi:uncharacterized SAM-binding protein YcdF (DUF218 family)
VDAGGAVDLEVLFRHRPVEVGAICLLALGGLLLPIPLWAFGAVTALLSRTWENRDKVMGLLLPPLVAAVAVLLVGGAEELTAARTGDTPLLLRLAGPAGAIYLGARLLRATGVRSVRLRRERDRP